MLIVKVNAQAKKNGCAFSLTKAPCAFSLTNEKRLFYRLVIHLTISFLRAILPNLREAESSSVEAQLEEEYLRWINGKASEISGFFFWLSRYSKYLKNFGGWGSAPSSEKRFKTGVRLLRQKSRTYVTPRRGIAFFVKLNAQLTLTKFSFDGKKSFAIWICQTKRTKITLNVHLVWQMCVYLDNSPKNWKSEPGC